MPQVFASGSNLFQQCDSRSEEPCLTTPVEIVEADSVLAVSWSQVVLINSTGEISVAGLPLLGTPRDLRGCQFLGHDSFTATVLDGRITPLDETIPQTRFAKYGLVAMNGHGEILATHAEDSSRLHLYSSLVHAMDDSKPSLEIRNPSSEPILHIAAGAGHFLLLTANSVYSYGDDRFAQSGTSSLPTNSELHHIDFFDGLYPALIAAGDSHSAVVTRDGSLYMFGSDAEGQCGGFGGEPNLVTLLEGGVEDEELEVTAVTCGANHTAIATKTGSLGKSGIFVTGSNAAGQLGMGATKRCSEFVRLPLFDNRPARILAGKWNLFLVVTG